MPLNLSSPINSQDAITTIKFVIDDLLMPTVSAPFSQKSARRLTRIFAPSFISQKTNTPFELYFLIMPSSTGVHVSSFFARHIHTNHLTDMLGNTPGALVLRFNNFYQKMPEYNYQFRMPHHRSGERALDVPTANQLFQSSDKTVFEELSKSSRLNELAQLTLKTITSAIHNTDRKVPYQSITSLIDYARLSTANEINIPNDVPLIQQSYDLTIAPHNPVDVNSVLILYDLPNLIVKLTVAITLFDYEIIPMKGSKCP